MVTWAAKMPKSGILCTMIAMLQEDTRSIIHSLPCWMQSSCGKSSRLWPLSLPSGPGVLQKRAAMDAGRGQDGIECHHLEYGVIQFCLKTNTSNLAFLSMLQWTMIHDKLCFVFGTLFSDNPCSMMCVAVHVRLLPHDVSGDWQVRTSCGEQDAGGHQDRSGV